jgi:hypothetical protein
MHEFPERVNQNIGGFADDNHNRRITNDPDSQWNQHVDYNDSTQRQRGKQFDRRSLCARAIRDGRCAFLCNQ